MTKRLIRIALVVLGLALLAYWAFKPAPVPADLATVERGRLQVTVEEEGRTRVPRSRDSGCEGGWIIAGQDGTAGGRLYDAHIAEVAHAAGANVIVTDNRRHFLAALRHGIRGQHRPNSPPR